VERIAILQTNCTPTLEPERQITLHGLPPRSFFRNERVKYFGTASGFSTRNLAPVVEMSCISHRLTPNEPFTTTHAV
jgi:hypothetical protein